MHHFLQWNPGLRSRFSREIEFPDYSTDELVAITERLAAEYEYRLDIGATDVLRQILAGAARTEGFGNARFSRTLFEQALNAQALRLANAPGAELGELDRLELMTLSGDDFLAGARALGEGPAAEQARGGFWVGASAEPSGDQERDRRKRRQADQDEIRHEQHRHPSRTKLLLAGRHDLRTVLAAPPHG